MFMTCESMAKYTLSYMKTNFTTNFEWMSKIVVSSDISPYVRKGIVGGWQEWSSTEQSAQFMLRSLNLKVWNLKFTYLTVLFFFFKECRKLGSLFFGCVYEFFL